MQEIYRRPATEKETVYEAVLESFADDGGKPSRDAIAHCGTAMLIAGAAIGATTDRGWLGAGVLVFCMAWAKDKTNDE